MAKRTFSSFNFFLVLYALTIMMYGCSSLTPIIPDLLPSAPNKVSVVADNGSVFVSWEATPKAVVYSVYFSDNATGDYKPYISTDTTYAKVNSLVNGTTYYFKVVARNYAGRGSYSDVVTCIPEPPATVPTAPVIVVASIVDRNLFLAWNIVPTATNYEIYLSTDNLTFGTTYQTDNRFYSIKGLDYNKTYFVYVVADNERGQSLPSATMDITITSAVALHEAPTNVYALPADTSATIFWSKVDNASEYAVYQSVDGFTFEPIGNTANTYYVANNLQNGKQHTFKIVPINAKGASTSSSSTAVVPVATAYYLGQVKSIISTSLSHSIMLEWQAVPSAVAYNIYISENEDFTNFTLLKTVNNLKTIITGLDNNKAYYFKLSAISGRLEGEKSVVVTAIARDIEIQLSKPYAVDILVGDTLLLLSWSPVTYADRYIIERSTDNINFIAVATVNNNKFTDVALINGTRYHYRITPQNDVALGVSSDVKSGTPLAPTAEPTMPTAIEVRNIDDYITIDWDDVLNARYFNIYRSIGHSTEFSKISSSIVSDIKLTNLDDAVQYNFYITAVNERGESPRSLIVSTTYHNNVHIPNKILGVATSQSNGVISISWAKTDYATSYAVYVAPDGGAYAPVITTNSTSATINFSGSLGKYYIKISGINYLGEGENSDASTVDIINPVAVPLKVNGVTAKAYGKGVQISWAPVYSATEYRLYMLDSGSGNYILYDNYTTNVVSIDKLNDINGTLLSNNTQYSFYVTAINIIGESEASVIVTALTSFAPLPPAVVGISVVSLNTQINISWLASTYADYYEIWRAPNDSSALVHIANAIVTKYSDTELNNSTTYRYKIVAVNEIGSSSPSYFTAMPKAPDFRPTAPTITNAITGKTSILVVLQAVPSATSYRVYYKKQTDGEYILSGESANISFFIDRLTTGLIYDIKATAVNANGESDSSVVVRVATTNSNAVPSKPTGLSGDKVSGIVVLKWYAGGPSDQYYIYYSVDNRNYILFDITYYNAYALNFNAPNTSYRHYYFKIRRVANNMISDFSDYIQIDR